MMGRIKTTLAAIAALALAWGLSIIRAKRRARQDLKTEMKNKDVKNAQDIERRVADSRNDPKRVQRYKDHGWRD